MAAPKFGLAIALATAFLLVACGSTGPRKRISEPAAGIQQLTVRADGSWEVQLRLQNYSNVAMRFTRADLRIGFDGGLAAELHAQPGLAISPESADVVNLVATPTPGGRAQVATALADGRGLDYTLEGEVEAGPEDGKPRSYKIKRSSSLTPAPGLPGVLR